MARYRVKRDKRSELYLVLNPEGNEAGRFMARIQAREKAQELNKETGGIR